MGLISRVSSRTYRYKMFTTVARRNAGQKALDVLVIKPHKFILGKAGQYWAQHGKHVKAELLPTPAVIGGIPAAAANTMAFASGGFLKMSVKELVLTGMVAAEIGVWFCLGKIIGYDTRNFGEQMGTSFLGVIPLPDSLTKSNF